MPDALTSTFTAVNRQTRGDLPQLDGTNTTRFRPTYLRHAGPTSVKLPQIGWERTKRPRHPDLRHLLHAGDEFPQRGDVRAERCAAGRG